MPAEPDGAEVVRSAAEALGLAQPPLLVLDRVEAFLDETGIGVGPVEWERIGEGQSNVTYLLSRGGRRVVLRRGPRPPLPRSAHDMLREARILRALAARSFPVPEVLAVCEDEAVLGVPFYLMEYVEGIIVTTRMPRQWRALDRRAAVGDAVVALLVELHGIDVSEPVLAAIGRPEGYLERQVERFTAMWPQVSRRVFPAVERIGGWLRDRVPETQRFALIHGDFRVGNIMFRPEDGTGVRALLDWEMATLGDPLADLGYLIATYAEPGRPSNVMELTTVTREEGFASRADLVRRYRSASGLDVSELPWYEALALWKAAIFCEAIYTRWLAGERPADTTFGPALERGVPQLLELAARAVGLIRGPVPRYLS